MIRWGSVHQNIHLEVVDVLPPLLNKNYVMTNIPDSVQ